MKDYAIQVRQPSATLRSADGDCEFSWHSIMI